MNSVIVAGVTYTHCNLLGCEWEGAYPNGRIVKFEKSSYATPLLDHIAAQDERIVELETFDFDQNKRLEADNARLRESGVIDSATIIRLTEALERIAEYGTDGICPYGCDTPDIAHTALSEGEWG